MEGKEFEKLWNQLPEFLRRRRLNRAYNLIKPLAEKQLKELNFIKKSKDKLKDVGHIYVFNAVEDFWENVGISFLMGKSIGLRNFAFYPVRACMETRMRFEHFCKKGQFAKNMITAKEMLRVYFNLYNREKLDGGTGLEQAKAYAAVAEGLNLPSIEKVTKGELNPFPNIEILCKENCRADYKKTYFLYSSFLCESSHGKMIAYIMRKQSEDSEVYRRAIMLLIPYCKDMLVLVDKNFLSEKFREQVELCIKKIDNAIKGSPSLYERIFINVDKIKKIIEK